MNIGAVKEMMLIASGIFFREHALHVFH